MKTPTILLAVLLGSAVVGVAQASPSNADLQRREVSFADLNLKNNAGVKRLYLRIKTAARGMCGEPNWLVPARVDDSRRCADEAIARAVEAVNSPLLTSYHAAYLAR